jgi:hypothetical protein
MDVDVAMTSAGSHYARAIENIYVVYVCEVGFSLLLWRVEEMTM